MRSSIENILFSLLLLTVILPITFSYPYGYYGSYSRTRRDPTAWSGGYGVQQNQMPVVPNARGSYGGPLESQGMGIGGGYGQGGHESSMYGMNQYGQASRDNSHINPMLGHQDSSLQGSAGNMHQPGDLTSYKQAQQQYPNQLPDGGTGGHGDIPPLSDGWDSQVPSECQGVACQSLLNCINVTTNGTKCCPECIQYGCVCEGYQIYHCELNGFSDGMVPEGKSYAVADGTTICSCPPGGGSIMCSFHDPSSSRCPEPTPNCVKTFVRDLDGCEECAMVGCVSDSGEKVEAGLSIEKPPCSRCYCPPDGGTMICGTDKTCEAKLKLSGGSTSLAMESSIRELGTSEQNPGQSSLGSAGYAGYNGYGGYPDYGGQYGTGGAGAPVIPPVMPLGDPKDKSSVGLDNTQGTGGLDSQGTPDLGTGMGSYGSYQQGYGGYQGQYGSFGQGYGSYMGYDGMNGGYGGLPYNGAYNQQGIGVGESDKTPQGASSKDTSDVESQGTNNQEQQLGGQVGQGAGGAYQQHGAYPYYQQAGLNGYGEYGSIPQQPYVPSQIGSQGPSESGSPTKQDPNGQLSSGANVQNSHHQKEDGLGQGGYAYPGYGKTGYYQSYNPYGYGQYPHQTGGQDLGQTAKESSESTDDHSSERQVGEYGTGYNRYMESYGQYPYGNQLGSYGQPLGPVGEQGLGATSGADTASQADRVSMTQDEPTNTDQQGVGQPKSFDELSKLAAGYNTDYRSSYGPHNPHYQKYPGYPYGLNKVGSQYDPVNPGLTNPGTPVSLPQRPEPGRSNQKETTETLKVATPRSRKKSKKPKAPKNRRAHVKAEPSVSPATTESPPRKPLKASKQKSAKQASYENVLSRCCYTGRQWALDHDTCTGISVTVDTYSQICAVAQEKCCLEAKEHQYCQGGIDTARSMAACDVPANLGGTCGGNEFKTCCDCCAMGLKALGLGLNCDVKIFGEPCNRAYTECCQHGRTDTGSPHLPDAAPTAKSNPSVVEKSPGIVEPTGPQCSTDSECQQICKDTAKGMVCSCRQGFTLHRNKKDCVDVNECVLNIHTCTEHQFCLNNEGSYICQRRISCGTGYELTGRNTCEDIDECTLGIHDCGNMDCENIRGSYRCIPKLCDAGFFTDATGRCIDIDECRAGDYICPKGATCTNTDGSYDCQCPTGFVPDSGNLACEDIDECSSGAANCAEGATCINTAGSFICRDPPKLRCTPGYQPNEAVTECVDIDECSEGTHTCKAGSTCINVDGGFRCQDPLVCPKGLKPDEDQRVCLDIDECQDPSRHRCDVGGRCQNTHKSFKCICDSGYVNANTDDGVPTCVDVDECAGSAGRTCKYKCRNTPGSYECYCPDGYKLGSFGSTCDDIDECAQPTSPCSDGETCFNTYGSFRCVALTCPAGYTRISGTRCQRKSCRILRTRSCPKMPKQISFHNISLQNGTMPDKPLFRMSLARSHSTDRYEFLITDGNEKGDFKVKSSSRIKRPTGVVYTARKMVGPADYVIDLSLKLNRQRRWSTFVSRLYIFVGQHDL